MELLERWGADPNIGHPSSGMHPIVPTQMYCIGMWKRFCAQACLLANVSARIQLSSCFIQGSIGVITRLWLPVVRNSLIDRCYSNVLHMYIKYSTSQHTQMWNTTFPSIRNERSNCGATLCILILFAKAWLQWCLQVQEVCPSYSRSAKRSNDAHTIYNNVGLPKVVSKTFVCAWWVHACMHACIVQPLHSCICMYTFT